MFKFKRGDKIIIVSSKFPNVWYSTKLGETFVIDDLRTNQYGNYYRGSGFRCGVYESDLELVKEEEEVKFDMKKEPWFVRYSNEEEFKLIDEWVKENYGDSLGMFYQNAVAMTNINQDGFIPGNIMWLNEDHINSGPVRHEIKFTFKTVIDSVTFPEVKTEQQKQIEELEKTISLAKQQIEQLKKGE